jgi:hypothetical protein
MQEFGHPFAGTHVLNELPDALDAKWHVFSIFTE